MKRSTRSLPVLFYLFSGGFFVSLLLFTSISFASEVHILPSAITFTGFTPLQIQQLQNKSPEEISPLVAVYVVGTKETNSPIPIFGSTKFSGQDLIFKPRFNFVSNQAYKYQLALEDELIQAQFQLESKPATPTAKVIQVYPSAETLPENLFKFYIQFNQAMSQGNIYRHISLLDEKHLAVELPFLELTAELWNPEGTRLTLLFDPGRTKQGIKPNRDMGLPLQEGKRFTLVISENWQDATGQPMLKKFKKEFLVTARDIQQPDIKNWLIGTPANGTKDPLIVTFDETLDFALIQNSIHVKDHLGESITGNITISDNETQWQFSPETIWVPGKYTLSARSYLEDVSANSLGRAFEVIRTNEDPNIPDEFSIEFTISAKGLSH